MMLFLSSITLGLIHRKQKRNEKIKLFHDELLFAYSILNSFVCEQSASYGDLLSFFVK